MVVWRELRKRLNVKLRQNIMDESDGSGSRSELRQHYVLIPLIQVSYQSHGA